MHNRIFIWFVATAFTLSVLWTIGSVAYHLFETVRNTNGLLFWSILIALEFVFLGLSLWAIKTIVYPRTLADVENLQDRMKKSVEQVNAFQAKLAELEQNNAGDKNKFFSIQTALMGDASAWAIHFSNVRLGIMTLAVPLTLAVIATKFKSGDPVAWVAAWMFWITAVFVFVSLTNAQRKHLAHRRQNLNNLMEVSVPNPGIDPYLKVVVALTCILIVVTCGRIGYQFIDPDYSTTEQSIEGTMKEVTSQGSAPQEYEFKGRIVEN